jgi:hypothetical protein
MWGGFVEAFGKFDEAEGGGDFVEGGRRDLMVVLSNC